MDNPLLIELNRKLDKILGKSTPVDLSNEQDIREQVRNLMNKKKLKKQLQ